MMMIAFRHAKKEWEKKKRGMYVAKIKQKNGTCGITVLDGG